MKYSDYPSADSFSYLNGNLDDEDYLEGIYVLVIAISIVSKLNHAMNLDLACLMLISSMKC
jgi:hypothetical protein